MKKYLLLLFLFVSIGRLSAQVVNEQVNFDNPSDQSDHFYGMQSLIQIPTNGVSGGCLQLPDSNNWGNDNSRYCSKYKAQDTVTFVTRIKINYSGVTVNPNSFDRAASLWLQPHTDPNHYVIASLTHDRKLELLSYFTANSSSSLILTNNEWYELILTFTLHNDSAFVNLQMNDRGPTGISPPIPSGNINIAFGDSVFARDNAIEVSLTGSQYGGGQYIDDFSFQGIKSADSCLTTAVPSIETNDIRIINEGSCLKITGTGLADESYDLYEFTGKLLQSGQLKSNESVIDISKIKSGNYIIRLANSRRTFKIFIAD